MEKTCSSCGQVFRPAFVFQIAATADGEGTEKPKRATRAKAATTDTTATPKAPRAPRATKKKE